MMKLSKINSVGSQSFLNFHPKLHQILTVFGLENTNAVSPINCFFLYFFFYSIATKTKLDKAISQC